MRRLVYRRHSTLPAVRSVAFAALALLVAATGASATVRIVDSQNGPDPGPPPVYVSIFDAVDAADPGDVIIVRPGATGSYTECVELNVVGLVVVAAGDVTIVDDNCEFVVKITADNVRFQGFQIDGDGCDCGGIKTTVNGAQILTNYIGGGVEEGIHVGGSGAAPETKNNILSNNYVDSCDDVGIYLDSRSKASQLFGNVVAECYDDNLRVLARNNVITDNVFLASQDADGIDIDNASAWNNKFKNNVSVDNYDWDFEQIAGVSGTSLSGNVFPGTCSPNCDDD